MDEQQIAQRKKESAMLLKYAAMKKAQEEIIGTSKIYIDMVGDHEAALVLDELLFWTLPKNGKSSLRVWKEGFLWLAVSRSEWWERKRLSERQADRAILKLMDKNLVFKDVFKFNSAPTTHLRINVPAFFEMLFSEIEKTAVDDENKDFNEIKDLYEMMGIPFSPNGKLPNGDSDSPNGENINSTDSVSTQHSKKPIALDFKSMTVIQAHKLPTLKLYRDAVEYFPGSPAWEFVHNTILEHSLTFDQLHSAATAWALAGFKQANIKGLLEWAVNGVPERYQVNITPKKTDEERPEYRHFQPDPNEKNFVPAPPRRTHG